jgi:hypothetical protein
VRRRLLELGQARPEDEALFVADRFDHSQDLGLDTAILGFQIQ